MIVLVDAELHLEGHPERRARFLDAVRGRPYFGDLLPAELAVFGAMHGAPVPRFFAVTPAAALCIRGRGALLCGTYDEQETGAFLQLHGVEQVQTDGAPPAGYVRERRLCCMAFSGARAAAAKAAPASNQPGAAGAASNPPAAAAAASNPPAAPVRLGTSVLPGVPVSTVPPGTPALPAPCMGNLDETAAAKAVPDAALPSTPPIAGLTLDTAPPPGETADFLMRAKGAEIRDNFYAELCAKLARGAACVWAVRRDRAGDRDGQIIATAGAYALTPETAYLAAIETAAPLRGRGIGSWLVGVFAAHLACEGRRVALVCGENRTAFYKRLGFETENTIWRCTREPEA